MKFLTLIVTFLLSCNFAWSQKKGDPDRKPSDFENSRLPQEDHPKPFDSGVAAKGSVTENAASEKNTEDTLEVSADLPLLDNAGFSPLKRDRNDTFKEFKPKFFERKNPPPQSNGYEKFHWKPAIRESLYFLGIQQGFRLVQKKTRREIKGPFLRDWANSVKNLGKWKDGDSFATNYIAHPMQGAVTGRIFLNNSERSRRQEFGSSKDYWKSRFKAMAWSAVWSAQFELGPVSEASIGNVGLYDRTGPNRMGWVDLVVTPTAGTGVIIGEDMIDKFVLKNWLERDARSLTRIKLFRTFFTPFQSFTNVLGGKVPWKRYNR